MTIPYPGFWGAYPTYFTVANQLALEWSAAYDLDANSTIEILTLPSNPQGDIYTPVYPDADHLYDLVYYWPHLAPNLTAMLSHEVMVFSLTNLSGHASTRFGWALIKDPTLAATTTAIMAKQTQEVSTSIINRATVILKALAGDTGDIFFPTIKQFLHDRWDRILALFNSIPQTRVSMAGTPYTSYLWLQFLRPEEQSDNALKQIFANLYISGDTGTEYGDTTGKFRINLTLHSYPFEILLKRLSMLLMG